MFLNSSGPPQQTYSKDILPINDFVHDRCYTHRVKKYESDTKNADSQGLHDGKQITRAELQKAYSS